MNIFVANLSYRIQDEDLRSVFEEYGEVSSAKIIMDRETGKSRGFAFVEMSDDEAGKKAIEELNGAEYDERELVVKQAEDRGGNRGGGNRGGGFRGGNRGGGGGYDRNRRY